MVDKPFKKSRMHKEWQQMASLQPYCKGNKAFSWLYCQSLEYLIFAAVEGSKNYNSSRKGKKNLGSNDIMCVIDISLKT